MEYYRTSRQVSFILFVINLYKFHLTDVDIDLYDEYT